MLDRLAGRGPRCRALCDPVRDALRPPAVRVGDERRDPGAHSDLTVTYPFYTASLLDDGGLRRFPTVETTVIMVVFVIMAIGLNIVVGYAGLLDLGYVAFYAMGAYTCAWFASVQFASHNIQFGAVGVGESTPGIHISIWAPDPRRHRHRPHRHPHRPAHAATARRLSGDRHARLRRDPASDRAQRRQPRAGSTSPTGRTGSRRSIRPGSGTSSYLSRLAARSSPDRGCSSGA